VLYPIHLDKEDMRNIESQEVEQFADDYVGMFGRCPECGRLTLITAVTNEGILIGNCGNSYYGHTFYPHEFSEINTNPYIYANEYTSG